MHQITFEDALELILSRDARYHRDAYLFVREALEYTQKTSGQDKRGRMRHVSGQELLAGIRDFALDQFGPMAMTVLEEWGIRQCEDFGEIVFNMVEIGGSPAFKPGDIKDLPSFTRKLETQSDPVSELLWSMLSEPTRQKLPVQGAKSGGEALLIKELNEIISARPLYQPQRFSGVNLSGHTKALLGQELKGLQLAHLNRLLLEDVYPLEIAKSGGLLAKTEKDSRADFAGGYDFFEAFRRPFLPAVKGNSGAPSAAANSSSN